MLLEPLLLHVDAGGRHSVRVRAGAHAARRRAAREQPAGAAVECAERAAAARLGRRAPVPRGRRATRERRRQDGAGELGGGGTGHAARASPPRRALRAYRIILVSYYNTYTFRYKYTCSDSGCFRV